MMRRGIYAIAACLALAGASVSAQLATWPRENPPRPLPARPVSFPPYEVRTLPNGMQVIVVMHHEQPEVTMRILVRGGAAYDPPGKRGTAALMASLLNQGTASRTAHQIADAIDSIGGALDTAAGADASLASVLVMKDSFDVGMDLLADVVRRPSFTPEEIERQRTQRISSLGVSLQDPGFLAGAVLSRLIYGFHPYGLPDSGIPETIAQITRDDLREFHQRYFVPNNAILAVVGDISVDEAMAAAEREFGDWPRQELKLPPLPEPPRPTRRIVVIDKPDSVQTAVRVGQLGIPRKSPDYMNLEQAVRILGGEGSNRLFRVLRSERGLTYSASADINTMLLAGDISAETDTRTNATGEAVRVIVDEFTRLQRERVGDAELAGAQAYMAGSFPLEIETPGAIARHVVNAVFYELPLDELRTYRQRVTAVSPDDLQRVARTYVQPDRLSIVLVGNAAEFKDQLAKAGFPNYELIPLAQLDLTAADLIRR